MIPDTAAPLAIRLSLLNSQMPWEQRWSHWQCCTSLSLEFPEGSAHWESLSHLLWQETANWKGPPCPHSFQDQTHSILPHDSHVAHECFPYSSWMLPLFTLLFLFFFSMIVLISEHSLCCKSQSKTISLIFRCIVSMPSTLSPFQMLNAQSLWANEIGIALNLEVGFFLQQK